MRTFNLPRLDLRAPIEKLTNISIRLLLEGHSIKDILTWVLGNIQDKLQKLEKNYADNGKKLPELSLGVTKEWLQQCRRLLGLEISEDELDTVVNQLYSYITNINNSAQLKDLLDKLEALIALRAWKNAGGKKNRVYELLRVSSTQGRRILDNMVQLLIEENAYNFSNAALQLKIDEKRLENWYKKIKNKTNN